MYTRCGPKNILRYSEQTAKFHVSNESSVGSLESSVGSLIKGNVRMGVPRWTGVLRGLLLAGLAVVTGWPTPGDAQEGSVSVLKAETEPVLSIGVMDGPDAYQLYRVDGAVRLSDGSVVVVLQAAHEIRRFGPDGKHQWTFGRFGDGPGEFQLVELLPTCTSDDRIAVYDRMHRRLTILSGQGEMVLNYPLSYNDMSPHSRIVCSPGGRMVFTDWGNDRVPVAGPHRWNVDVLYTDGSGASVEVLRRQVPGEDRVLYMENGVPLTAGPRTWGRRTTLAAMDDGVWLGTGDDYEIEFVSWAGTTTGRISWTGPDLSVTRDYIDAYRESVQARFQRRYDDDWRARFQGYWDEEQDILPSAFPAYTRVLLVDGSLWVQEFARPGEVEQRWLVFGTDGDQKATVRLSAGPIVLDAGSDWILANTADNLGIERLVVYALVPG